MVVMDAFKRRFNAGEDANFYFMRTSNGVEVDLVEEIGGKLNLHEIKSACTFHGEMAKNLRAIKTALANEIGKMYVVYGGDAASVDGVEYVNFASDGW